MTEHLSLRCHQLLTVLTVDDNKFTRDLLRKILVSFGISDVTPAECGEEALRLLSASSYDLVICDIVMTGISGIQFLKALRNKDVFPGERHNTPIIMLTAHADETLVIASMKAGANGYLVKPVIPGRLMPLIAKFCHSTLPTLGSCTRTEAAPVSLRR